MFCLKHLLCVLFLLCATYTTHAQAALGNAFSHNDYWHKHPLYDALNNGYAYIETDIYLRGNSLVVAHILPCLRKKRTLENLYLGPLLNGKYKNGDSLPDYPITLLIDIKSDAERTYRALDSVLEKYKSIITSYDSGTITRRKVTIVLSGNKPYAILKSQTCRRAFIDEDLRKTGRDSLQGNIYLTASCRYSHLLTWNGRGTMPVMQKKQLCRFIHLAHLNEQKVRLWASPENTKVWKALLECGVDLINTNKLVKLKDFLLADAGRQTLAGGVN
jgi:hypothetical protein